MSPRFGGAFARLHPIYGFAFSVLAVVCTLIALASGEETLEQPKPQPSDQMKTHVFNYGDRDSTCIRWTDECRTCNRNTGAEVSCSNIGIACQPAETVCLERQQNENK